MSDEERPSSPIVEGVKEGLVEEAGRWLKWAFGGALLGALVLGGLGLYWFGLTGLGIGAAAGAVLGGFGAWLFYVSATSLS